MTTTGNPSGPDNPEGFPWGSNQPSRRQRLVVAALVALVAGSALVLHDQKLGPHRTDFSQLLFGARAIIHGSDPYALVGPGRIYESPWPLMYPATAFVAAIPLVNLADTWASAFFVAASVFLLVFGSTRDSWHRLPMFASIAFTFSVQLAQWSTLITAMLFWPLLAAFTAVKPQSALPVLVVNPTRKNILAASVGGAVLLGVSLVILPGWATEWLRIIRHGEQFRPPLLRFGGFLVVLSLLRWRRPEAWLVFLFACVPQSWAWYNALPLLVIALTYREACVLSLISSVGALVAAWFIEGSSATSYPAWGAALVAFAYLPATIAILLRPNVRARAPWDTQGRGNMRAVP